MTIIHGDHQIASRQFFLDLKATARDHGLQIVDLPGDSLNLESLVTASQSQSLLGGANAVFVEGFFSRRPSNDKKTLLEYFSTHSDLEVVLWDGKDVSAQLKGLPATAVKKFDLPKIVWKFIDTLAPDLFHQVVQTTEPELLLGLLAGRLRQLIMIVSGGTPAGLASWQVGKLKSQAGKFTLDQLITAHRDLLDLDFRQKTSESASNLASALELWLLKLVN